MQCHVADSGRLKELIFPGNRVMVRKAPAKAPVATGISSRIARITKMARITPYDLVLASASDTRSPGRPIWVSVDTRYPNLIFGQALRAGAIREISPHGPVHPEYWYHYLSPWKEEAEREEQERREREQAARAGRVARPVRSRMDFFLDAVPGGEPCLVEVKSVTLCRDGAGYFPDAPTERGARHLRELTRGVREGYRAYAVFVAQREDIQVVKPNRETDPGFAAALREAQDSGVRLLGFGCSVTATGIRLNTAALPVVV